MSGPPPPSSRPRAEIVVIGTSWGGYEAVVRLLDAMPQPLGCGMVLVQHRAPEPSELARLLARHVSWPVREADDKDLVEPGVLLVAPPDYHLLVEPGHVTLSTEAPVRYSRPSIDVLFESAADAYGAGTVGVLLTGANDDGARGLVRIRDRGGVAIVQDPATAARPQMPSAALSRLTPALVGSLEEIADRLNDLSGGQTPLRAARGDRP